MALNELLYLELKIFVDHATADNLCEAVRSTIKMLDASNHCGAETALARKERGTDEICWMQPTTLILIEQATAVVFLP